MKKVFYIDGGAGRAIAAIPALRKYYKLNPNTDWNVIVVGWDALYWGIPELQDRTYSTDTKGVFDNIIADIDVIIAPEPYRLPGYFKQQLSLAQAFDQEINNTNDHSDLELPQLIFNKAEEKWATNTIADIRSQQQKTKTIIFQPFGRGARLDRADVIDDGSRSLSPDAYISLVRKLAAKYNLVFFGEPQFQITTDTYTVKLPSNTDLRMWAALIDMSDYFVGVDSAGQHLARATNTPGTVIFGSTFPINVSYPDWFNIIEKPGYKKYNPIRIAGLDSQLSDRLNDFCMDFSESELIEIYNKICQDIEKKVK
jgi:hypothetical protein